MAVHVVKAWPRVERMRRTRAVTIEPVDPNDADGVFTPRNEFVKAPVLLIPTNDIDETIEKEKAAGGEILNEKEKVGEFGYSAYGKDTEGTVFCLWQALS